MSRWIESFESHPFQAIWAQLKENLEISGIDDKTIITDVKELARLKKAVAYIDGLISGIDPEMVPLSIWDNFEAQAQPCNQKIIQFSLFRRICG